MTTAIVVGNARDAEPHPGARTTFRIAAAVAVLTVATGAINSATGSGFACETWPGCFHGHFAPHPEVRQLIEFGHRLIAASCVVTVLAAAVVSRRLPRSQRLARLMPWVALVGIAGSAIFGALTVVNLGIAKPLSVLDLLCALTTMVAMTVATLSLERGAPVWHWTPLARLASGTVVAITVMHLLGTVVAGSSSFTAVLGWPLQVTVARDVAPALQHVRLALAVVDALLVALVALRSRHQRGLGSAGIAALALLVVELVLGRVVMAEGLAMWLSAAYGATAALVLFAVALVAGRAGLEEPVGR